MKKILVVLVMTVTLVGCTETRIQQSAKVAAGIAAGLDKVQQENEILYRSGKLSKDEARLVAEAVVDGTHANDAFVACVRGIKGNANSKKAEAINCFLNLERSLSAVEAKSVRVSNPESAAKIKLAFASVDTVLTGIAAYLGVK